MSLQLPCRLPTTFLRQHSSIVFQSQGKAIDDQEIRSVRNVSDPFLTRRVGAEGRLIQRQSHLAIDYDSNTVRRVFKYRRHTVQDRRLCQLRASQRDLECLKFEREKLLSIQSRHRG